MKRTLVKAGFTALLTLIFATSAWSENAPLRDTPNLTSISVWEVSTNVFEYTFSPTNPALTTRLTDPLGALNHDIQGVASEYYDIFYSDANGVFNESGAYLTVEAVYTFGLPFGGGLNLAEVGLNILGYPSPIYGNTITHFVALGDNAILSDIALAADSELGTFTTMGNTIGQAAETRLSVTIGLPVSEPSKLLLIATGLMALVTYRLRKRS